MKDDEYRFYSRFLGKMVTRSELKKEVDKLKQIELKKVKKI